MKMILSWLATAAVICLAIYLSHMPLTAVIQPSALILVLGPQLIFLIFEYGQNIFGFISRLSQNAATELDQGNLAKAIALGMLFSAFGYILGTIQIMRNLNSVDQIGPGIALSLMSALYSAVTPILFIRSLSKEQLKTISFTLGMYIFLAATAALSLTFFALHTLK